MKTYASTGAKYTNCNATPYLLRVMSYLIGHRMVLCACATSCHMRCKLDAFCKVGLTYKPSSCLNDKLVSFQKARPSLQHSYPSVRIDTPNVHNTLVDNALVALCFWFLVLYVLEISGVGVFTNTVVELQEQVGGPSNT